MNQRRIFLLSLVMALPLAGCDDYGGYSYVRPDVVNGPAYYGAEPQPGYGYAAPVEVYPVGGYYESYEGGYVGSYYGGVYPVVVGGGRRYWRPPPGPPGWRGGWSHRDWHRGGWPPGGGPRPGRFGPRPGHGWGDHGGGHRH